jgi:hypothetical protein
LILGEKRVLSGIAISSPNKIDPPARLARFEHSLLRRAVLKIGLGGSAVLKIGQFPNTKSILIRFVLGSTTKDRHPRLAVRKLRMPTSSNRRHTVSLGCSLFRLEKLNHDGSKVYLGNAVPCFRSGRRNLKKPASRDGGETIKLWRIDRF